MVLLGGRFDSRNELWGMACLKSDPPFAPIFKPFRCNLKIARPDAARRRALCNTYGKSFKTGKSACYTDKCTSHLQI